LKPHVIVETSPGRYHAHWRVEGLPLGQFVGVQRAIAKRFDGDPAIAIPTHLARLPGFYHRKGKPFRCEIIETNDLPPYSPDEIIREFPPEQTPHKLPVSLAGRILLPSDDPVTCAGEFLNRDFRTPSNALRLQYYRNSFYQWTGTHYTEIDAKEVRSKLYAFLKDATTIRKGMLEPFKPNKNRVNSILDALESGVIQPRAKNAPFWVEPMEDGSADGLVPCCNGLLDIATRKVTPHSPYLFNVNCLPFHYDPHAPTPELWLEFLWQLWPGEEGKQARFMLQEIFGLLLTADTRYQKILMIVGPRRSGKGTIARVLTALLGRDSVANPTLASLSTNFGLSPLIDKRAAIISDARLGPSTNAHAVAERLLSISGEDALTIDRKYREPWNGQLGVRFLILTNELPRILDASGALASRFEVLMLSESFYGREDLELTDKLLRCLPGILNWSLRGLDRLRKRGRFQMPESSLAAIQQLEDLASPVSAFIREWCSKAPAKRVNVKVLYDAWAKWCEQGGHNRGNNIVFGRNLKAAVPQIKTKGAGADRFYQGIGLSKSGQKAYDLWLRQAHRY
jgi:putative DNA primase/helicase